MKIFFSAWFLALISLGFSQQIYFSFPFQLSGSATGNVHPRVALVNNEPIVVWGDPSSDGTLQYSLWNGSGFDSPQQLTYSDEMIMMGYAEGPVMLTKGDSVFVCYVSMAPSEHRVYLRKSIDGGLNFSDTILVNDRSNGLSLEFANMTLDENGNPMIVFIRFEQDDVPKHVYYRSFDGGNTFTGEINATPDTSSQPCECCPAALISDNSFVYCIYRNNDDNIRDFYVSVSENGGISFDSLQRIDNSNWYSVSCPVSGPAAMISGDSIISVYMNKENNQSMIKANTMHKTDFTVGPEYYVDPGVLSATYQMNYPEIAGNGDTIGIVWQDNRSGQVKSYFSYSVSGMNGLSAPILLSDFISGLQLNPHLVYKNGTFHFVWRDYSNNIVWYRKASFDSSILSVAETNQNLFSVHPNPSDEYFFLEGNFDVNERIEILDLTGRQITEFTYEANKKINTGNLLPGVYIIKTNKFGSKTVLIR